MSNFRKVFGPVALAMGFLVFLGAIGQAPVQVAQAVRGDLCKIEGPYVEGKGLQKWMGVGERALIVARVENNTNSVTSYDIDLDDEIGDTDITTIFEEDNPYDYDDEPGTDQVDANVVIQLSNRQWIDDMEDYDYQIQMSEIYGYYTDDDDEDLLDEVADLITIMEDDFGYEFVGDVCTGTNSASRKYQNNSVLSIIEDCIDGTDDNENTRYCDDHAWEDLIDGDANISVEDIAKIITDELAAGEDSCSDIAIIVGRAIVGIKNDDEDKIQDDIYDICAGEALSNTCPSSCSGDKLESWWDDMSPVIVTCNRAGTFEITFTEDDDPDQFLTLEIVCKGVPASNSTIAASRPVVEIVPAMGSISHSLITVTLLDKDGVPAGAGFEVDFTTNRCTIETSGVDTTEEYAAANATTAGGFRSYNASVAATAAAIEASAAANAAVDSSRSEDSVVSFISGDNAVAAAVLGCNPADTGGTTAVPGTATIQAVIQVDNGQDVVKTVTVTVVGPGSDLRVTASPSSLRCGEKATITATVKDSNGANVSDHTRVEAVTNFGGVLGGTGAVAGNAGPVVPVSSTVAETFDGVATFYLLTSESNAGPYEVVVTTGGSGSVNTALGGVFSTRPQVAQQTVTCSLPAPVAAAPAVSAPRTGTGSITPPSTGDAGLLADSTSTSWALFSVIGAAAFAVAGLAGLKVSRR